MGEGGRGRPVSPSLPGFPVAGGDVEAFFPAPAPPLALHARRQPTTAARPPLSPPAPTPATSPPTLPPFSGGLSPPLYIHSDETAQAPRVSEASAEAAWEARVAALFRHEVGAVARYGGPDPVAGLLAAVRRDLGLAPADAFAEVPSRAGDR